MGEEIIYIYFWAQKVDVDKDLYSSGCHNYRDGNF